MYKTKSIAFLLICCQALLPMIGIAETTASTTTESSSVYPVTSTSTSTSAAGAYGNTGNWTQTFESSKNPNLPGVISGPVSAPTLFNVTGRTAQVGGLIMLSRYIFPTEKHDEAMGSSGRTEIIFTGKKLPRKPDMQDWTSDVDFSGACKGEVIGSLTIQSCKGYANKVDFSTLIYDASMYVKRLDYLKGYKIKLLSSPDAITWANGVDSKAGGFAVSPVLSTLVSSTLNSFSPFALGISPGFSNTSGMTVPVSILGCTFLVVSESQNGIDININNKIKANDAEEHDEEVNEEGDSKDTIKKKKQLSTIKLSINK